MCYNAGSTLDEILLLDEEEFILLSKEIVGNGLLDHARVLKQWRHARMEALVRMEVMEELERNGEDEVFEEVQEDELSCDAAVAEWEREYNAYHKEEQVQQEKEEPSGEDLIGEDWQAYLRKHIKAEMQQLQPQLQVPAKRRKDAASSNLPKVVRASISDEEESSCDDETWYSYDDTTITGHSFFSLPAIAEATADLIDTGMKAFFDPIPERRKPTAKIRKSPRAVEEELDPRYEVVLKPQYRHQAPSKTRRSAHC
jgi:hypothetical protein